MKNSTQQTEALTYRITIKGHLDKEWTHWFDGLTITQRADGKTDLSGQIIDQAALQTILRKIGNLNLTLISMNQIDETADERIF